MASFCRSTPSKMFTNWSCMCFRQKFGAAANSPVIIEQASVGEGENAPAPTIIHSVQRTGCMAAFESFGQFESYFDEILDLIEDFSSTATVSPKIMEAVESGSESQSTSINVSLSVDAPPRHSTTDEHQVQVSRKGAKWRCEVEWRLVKQCFCLRIGRTDPYSVHCCER